MPNDSHISQQPRPDEKKFVFFTVGWSVEGFIVLVFVKWLVHGSPRIYLFLIPWVIFGLVLFFSNDWMNRVTDKLLRQTDRLDKWNPPGLP